MEGGWLKVLPADPGIIRLAALVLRGRVSDFPRILVVTAILFMRLRERESSKTLFAQSRPFLLPSEQPATPRVAGAEPTLFQRPASEVFLVRIQGFTD